MGQTSRQPSVFFDCKHQNAWDLAWVHCRMLLFQSTELIEFQDVIVSSNPSLKVRLEKMSVSSICQRGYLFAKVCSSLSVQQFSLSIRKVVPSDTDLRAKPTLRTTICNLVAVWESSSKITWSSSGHSCMGVFVSVCFLGLQTPKCMGAMQKTFIYE